MYNFFCATRITKFFMIEKKASPVFLWWLGIVCIMVFIVMVLGAATRLTDSGLSITEWRPITGLFPPFTIEEWQRVFDLYRQTDEYQQVKLGITIEDFKIIFWWEYIHRLWGRMIGLALIIPFFVFMIWKILPKNFIMHGFALIILVMGQGVLGWWMVKSGLVDRVDVSQYRLAAHLGIAVIIYGYLLWLLMEYSNRMPRCFSPYRLAAGIMGLVYLTLIAGAFVSGQHAGLVYNEWPTMGRGFFPDDYWRYKNFFKNAFDHPVAAQFHHRILAYGVFFSALWGWYRLRGYKNLARPMRYLFFAVLVQLCLGVTLLWFYVPLLLALAHHITGLVLFGLSLWALHTALRA